MTGLQIATDIVAIVCMSVITITWLVFLMLAISIRRRVSRLLDSTEEFMDVVRGLPYIGRRALRALWKG